MTTTKQSFDDALTANGLEEFCETLKDFIDKGESITVKSYDPDITEAILKTQKDLEYFIAPYKKLLQ
jgi:hypothetical protein